MARMIPVLAPHFQTSISPAGDFFTWASDLTSTRKNPRGKRTKELDRRTPLHPVENRTKELDGSTPCMWFVEHDRVSSPRLCHEATSTS
ncbi:hypothetical protein AVEN_87448-1 [Araneus ventricosus]|uniref:Uncharacterized protein n=1 Tax=Araneus ventricosus TaxID=182803 RepID=A0A4Y2BL95_ARAVE|nr:hypothetical protein AVEN_87448-1 [Araneus ventricosus]